MMLARAVDIGGKLIEDKDGPAVELHGVHHRPGSLLFMEASGGRVAWVLDARATFWRHVRREDEWVVQHCPKEVGATLVEAAVYQGFLPCAGVVHVPLLVDGKLVCKSGYHRETQLILDLSGPPPSIPKTLSKEVAKRALERLLHPFRGFLDKGSVSRTALAAAILTAVLRPSMPTAPMLLIDGNALGCGKGKLARALSALGTGSLPAVVTEGHSEEEMEKRIASAVLQGAQAILLDNLQRLLASSTLESMLTEPVADIRGFGSLELLRVACRALVLCTANNAAVRVDLLRRSLPLRIAVTTENPELRRFGFDPVEEVLRGRRELLSAAFTIALAWLQERELEENRKHRLEFGSFEEWGDLVGGSVSWLTDLNPINLIEERKERDGNVSNERAVLQALYAWQTKQNPGPLVKSWKAKEAATGIDPELWVAVLPKHKEGTPPAHKVGTWLASKLDMVLGGKAVRRASKDRSDVVSWLIDKVADDPLADRGDDAG
jgi:putative DNA primase/helicase